MNIVLDTHVVLWYSLGDKRLSTTAKETIQETVKTDHLLISSITLWEIAWLAKRERIILNVPYKEYIETLLKMDPYVIIEITPDIAFSGAELDSSISFDPGDRIIAATSLNFNVPLVTADTYLRKSKLIKTIW